MILTMQDTQAVISKSSVSSDQSSEDINWQETNVDHTRAVKDFFALQPRATGNCSRQNERLTIEVQTELACGSKVGSCTHVQGLITCKATQ